MHPYTYDIHNIPTKDRKEEFDFIENYKYDKSVKNGLKNEEKNRYNNILPYDDNIVKTTNYINASWVTNAYIATQGPLENTVNDFWDMIWTTNCTTIVMLTQLQEKGISKCYCYYPTNKYLLLNEYKDKNDYIMLLSEKYISKEIVKREFIYNKKDSQRLITHYHYLKWYDFGCPDVKSFVKLIDLLPSKYPICIHCSAGVGRTGVLLTILTILNNHDNINIVDTIIKLREYRMGLVYNVEQLNFCYKVIDYIYKKNDVCLINL